MSIKTFAQFVLIASTLCSITGQVAQADVYFVAADNSGSTLLMEDERFAERLGTTVTAFVQPRLSEGDVVQVCTLGGATMRNVHCGPVGTVGRRFRADAAAKWMGAAVTQIGTDGVVSPQTNISGGLKATVERLRFAYPGEAITLLVYTDGAECSARTDCNAFVQAASRGEDVVGLLPEPDKGLLSGVNVVFLGVGQGLGDGNIQLSETLADVWRRWLTASGAESVTVLTQF